MRLPAELRFDGDEVYAWRDAATGDVVLSSAPRGEWREFMAIRDRLRAVPEDFLADRGQPTETRDPFAKR